MKFFYFFLGKLPTSSEVGINILIKDYAEFTTNEIKKNCLLYDGKNQIQLRIGDILVFYISKNKWINKDILDVYILMKLFIIKLK